MLWLGSVTSLAWIKFGYVGVVTWASVKRARKHAGKREPGHRGVSRWFLSCDTNNRGQVLASLVSQRTWLGKNNLLVLLRYGWLGLVTLVSIIWFYKLDFEIEHRPKSQLHDLLYNHRTKKTKNTVHRRD